MSRAIPTLGAVLTLVVQGSGCTPNVAPPVAPPPAPPAQSVSASGDGHGVSGHIGPEGGTFELAPNGLRLTLPPGSAGPEGLTLALMQESNTGLPAAAAHLGDAFRATPSLTAPSGRFLELRSVAVVPLPSACSEGGAALALEAPPEAGPGAGSGGPALTWQFHPARVEADRVVVELATLPPVRAAFVCGPDHQTAFREGTR